METALQLQNAGTPLVITPQLGKGSEVNGQTFWARGLSSCSAPWLQTAVECRHGIWARRGDGCQEPQNQATVHCLEHHAGCGPAHGALSSFRDSWSAGAGTRQELTSCVGHPCKAGGTQVMGGQGIWYTHQLHCFPSQRSPGLSPLGRQHSPRHHRGGKE